MRQNIALGLVLLFFIAGIRPLLPYVEYVLNYEYISNVLCVNRNNPVSTCNGKCHLSKQLQEVDENDTERSRSKAPKIEWERGPMIFQEDDRFSIALHDRASENKLNNYHFFIQEFFISPPKPPPKC